MSFLGNLKEFGKNAWDTIYDAGKTAVEVVYDVGKTGVDFVEDGANVVTSCVSFNGQGFNVHEPHGKP